MPSVSVVMAIWDGDSIPFFKLALTSLKNQIYTDFEVLIVSDGNSKKVFKFINNLPEELQILDLKYNELPMFHHQRAWHLLKIPGIPIGQLPLQH